MLFVFAYFSNVQQSILLIIKASMKLIWRKITPFYKNSNEIFPCLQFMEQSPSEDCKAKDLKWPIYMLSVK